MDSNNLIQSISAKDVNIDHFSRLAIQDETVRDELVKQLCTHPHIMVYYHCYYVLSKASQERPDLFYAYWQMIAPLLKHKNSYHRDIAMTLLAHLMRVDSQNLFLQVFDEYFEHLNDLKFMTAQYCVRNCAEILTYKPELTNPIITLLLGVEQHCDYSEKQKALLKGDVLDIIDPVYAAVTDRQGVNDFIHANCASISPKTKARARVLAEKYGLSSREL
jgi:hypothetical protein